MTSPRSNQSVPTSVWWLSMAMVALIAGAVVWGLDNEQNDLQLRADNVLSELPFTVEIEGRDATLIGSAETFGQIDQAERRIVELRGIRNVDATALTADIAAESSASFSIQYNGTQTVVRGVVSDAATAEALATSVATQFGAAGVVSEVSIDSSVNSPEWLGELPSLILGLDGWRSGVFTVSDDGASIIGVVDSQEIAETFTTDLAAATRLDVSYELDVITNRTPWFEITAADQTASLSGELSSQIVIDLTLAAAAARYEVVDSRVDVAPVIEAPWIDLLPNVVERLSSWPSWRLRIEGGVGTIDARAPSTIELQQTTSGLLDHLGIVWEDISIEVDEAALAAELTVAVSGSINFETASAVLDEESRHVLDGVVATLDANPSANLTIEGHTDSQGGEASNLRLSQDRAEAVVDYLVGAGIEANRLSAIGYGESQPIAENGTTFGRAKNRRIEFVVEGDGG